MPVFGHITGVEIGTTFSSRTDLYQAGIHRQLQWGIVGSAKEGAESIVLSGGYEDDEDYGDVVIYTGHGGNDPNTGRQVADQELTRQNLALARSCLEGLPIRVVRGSNIGSSFAPHEGYRYDGLFYVEDYWRERGRSGFFIWRFRLRREVEPLPIAPTVQTPVPPESPQRRLSTIQRVVRSTRAAQKVKELHKYRCQVCGICLDTPSGPYAESAHIRPLGAPHNGPDVLENILCLCPNHHVLFDYGAFSIGDDMSLIGTEGVLRTSRDHQINQEYLRYHREHYV